MMTNLSSSCEGWKDKNFWVGGNFDPFSSEKGARPVPRNYNIPGKYLAQRSPLYFLLHSC